MNLRKFDLNLLVIFQAIAVRGSVVGAAEHVGLSPSAVSHALSRLRLMFNDELFRRTPRGLEATERALELRADLATGLAHIAYAIDLHHKFDPSSSRRIFTMQIAEYVSGILLPRLVQRMRAEAPGISIQVLPFATSAEVDKQIADVQIRFTPGTGKPAVARTKRLLTDKFMVVMRHDHPAADQELTAELYANLNHARLSAAAIGTTIIDDCLAKRGLRRNSVITVPSWFDLPQIIEHSDLVAVVPSGWPLEDTRFVRLKATELPLPEVSFAIDLCWDGRSERDPGQRWFRNLISEIFKESRNGQSARQIIVHP